MENCTLYFVVNFLLNALVCKRKILEMMKIKSDLHSLVRDSTNFWEIIC